MEEPNVKAYYEFMVDAAVVFGANRSVAEQELLDSLRFEIELAKVLNFFPISMPFLGHSNFHFIFRLLYQSKSVEIYRISTIRLQ